MQPAVIPRPVQNSTQQSTSDAAAPAESVPATADTDMLNVVETTPGTARATSDGAAAAAASGTPPSDALPSIRFSAYFDPRATRPSLTFAPIARTLPTGGETIRVGRYSERENQPNIPHNTPSAAPVGFKSKVVSRRHCEFWCQDGKWYIKDVKSSSGTFLNHIRLSPPGTESKPFPVNDGDIVQLGIDFKGGEEMIFRCVKMRLELNRGWQSKPNAFKSVVSEAQHRKLLTSRSMTAHKRLRNMASSANSTTSQDCSICLNSIAVGSLVRALFVSC
jgi:E3 ubiquitin-protein ligase DMA1/2